MKLDSRFFLFETRVFLIIAPLFMCPACSGDGENADSDCDTNIKNKPCQEQDPVCVLIVSTASSPQKHRGRGCASRADYTALKDECERQGICSVAMCETSGCKAELPSSGILIDSMAHKLSFDCVSYCAEFYT